MVRTGLFMNEEENVFSACMTCEGRNKPFIPQPKKRAVFPAFITSAVLKGFVVPLSSGTDASKTTASLQAQSSRARRSGTPFLRSTGQCRASAGAYRLPAQPCARRFLAVRAGRGPTRRRFQILGQRPPRTKCVAVQPGAPGRDLGILDRCGPDAIQTLLQDAAEEFGRMAR